MSTIKNTIALVVGAMAISKAKEVIKENRPDLWASASIRMSSLSDTLKPFYEFKLNEPFSIIKPIFSEPEKNKNGYVKTSTVDAYVESQFDAVLIICDKNELKWKLARHTFEDFIIPMRFEKIEIPSPEGNLFTFHGSGEYEELIWLASRYQSSSDLDGWYYYLECVFQKSEISKEYATLENMRKALYPADGAVFHIEPTTYVEDGVEFNTWSVTPEPHANRHFEGGDYYLYKSKWTNYVRKNKPYNIMLYGRPGCGKTTLLKSWFYDEKIRVIKMEAKALVDNMEQAMAVKMAAPDVILVEDLDRISEDEGNLLLSFFEHHPEQTQPYHDNQFAFQPMIIASCNHPDRIPDACWRPGRMDQIVALLMPSWDDFLIAGAAMSARLGLDWNIIMENFNPVILDIHENQTTAHLEQLIERVKEFGYDYKIPRSDRTFNPPIKWTDV